MFGPLVRIEEAQGVGWVRISGAEPLQRKFIKFLGKGYKG